MNLDAIVMLCLPSSKQPRISIEKSSFYSDRNSCKNKIEYIVSQCHQAYLVLITKGVFERRTSTGLRSEAFSRLLCLDANKVVLL